MVSSFSYIGDAFGFELHMWQDLRNGPLPRLSLPPHIINIGFKLIKSLKFSKSYGDWFLKHVLSGAIPKL